MKVDKKKLYSEIESAIEYGVDYGEEVDLTAGKIMKIIEPIIIALEVDK